MFLQQVMSKRLIKGEGPSDATIAIIGEATEAADERAARPMQGPAGSILDECLHSARLVRSHCYISNVIKERTENIRSFFSDRGGFTSQGQAYVDLLFEELSKLPNLKVIITLGNLAMYAFINKGGITSLRGYPFSCSKFPGVTILPTIHPIATLRGQYIWRYYIMHDFMRAARYAQDGIRLVDPEIIVPDSYEEAIFLIDRHLKEDYVSFDIEVDHYEVSCISFSSDIRYSVSIPLLGYWSLEEETEIWRHIARLLEDPEILKIGQNLAFDISFLAMKNHIITKGYIDDTMIAHSVMYPDFEKGLGFLASIYCDVNYWKDMVSFKNIKKES